MNASQEVVKNCMCVCMCMLSTAHLEDPHSQGLGTLASVFRMGRGSIVAVVKKKSLTSFFLPFLEPIFPPISIAYLHW